MHTQNIKVCPYCGGKVTPQDRVCAHCGKKLDDTQVSADTLSCRKCGTSLQVGDKYCSKCGEKVDSSIAAVIKCPECGTSLEQSDKFCIHCGTRLSLPGNVSSLSCPHCGNSVLPYDRFCINCGQKLEFKKTTDEVIKPEQTSKPAVAPTVQTSLQNIPPRGTVEDVPGKNEQVAENTPEEQTDSEQLGKVDSSRLMARDFVGVNLTEDAQRSPDEKPKTETVTTQKSQPSVLPRSNPFSEDSKESLDKYERAKRVAVGDISSKYILSNNHGNSFTADTSSVSSAQTQREADHAESPLVEDEKRFIFSNSEPAVTDERTLRSEGATKADLKDVSSVDGRMTGKTAAGTENSVAVITPDREKNSDSAAEPQPKVIPDSTEQPNGNAQSADEKTKTEQSPAQTDNDENTVTVLVEEKTVSEAKNGQSKTVEQSDTEKGSSAGQEDKAETVAVSKAEGGETVRPSVFKTVVALLVLVVAVGAVGLFRTDIKARFFPALNQEADSDFISDEERARLPVLQREDNGLDPEVLKLLDLRELTREDNALYPHENDEESAQEAQPEEQGAAAKEEIVTEFNLSQLETADVKNTIIDEIRDRLYDRNGIFFCFNFDKDKVLLLSEARMESIKVTESFGTLDDGFVEFTSGKGRYARRFRLEANGHDRLRIRFINGFFINGKSEEELTYLRDLEGEEKKTGVPEISIFDRLFANDWVSEDGRESLAFGREREAIVLKFSDKTVITWAKPYKKGKNLQLMDEKKKVVYEIILDSSFEPEMLMLDATGDGTQWGNPTLGE